MACSNCGKENPLDIWQFQSDEGDYASFGDRGGGWAIIRPAVFGLINEVTNPSFETGTTGWTVISGTLSATNTTSFSGAYSMKMSDAGGGQVGAYYAALTIASDGSLCAAYRLKTCAGSTVSSMIGYSPGPGITEYETVDVIAIDGEWHEYTVCIRNITGVTSAAFLNIVVIPGPDCAAPTEAWLDAVIITKTTAPRTYFDGNTFGASWQGVPDSSKSLIPALNRYYGEVVFLGDLGLTLLGDDGSGMPPVERTVEAYARRPGGAQTGVHWGSRVLRLTFGVEGCSWQEVTYKRKRLQDLMAIDPMARCNGNELMLRRYCVDSCGEPDLSKYYELPVNYNSGLQYTRTGIFREKIILELVADQNPLFREPIPNCFAIAPNTFVTIYNPNSVSVPVEITFRNTGSVVIDQITQVTSGAVIKFKAESPNTGAPMPFNATWKFSNLPGEFGVTQQVGGVATDITSKLSLSGSNPGSFFVTPGYSVIYADLSSAVNAQVTLCFNKLYLSSDYVCGNCQD